MRRIVKGPASRTIARLVCLLFTFSFVIGPAILPAMAQEGEVKYKAIPVVILDFENVSDRPDPVLGRKAADALAVQLDPERYEVIERATVQNYLDDLKLTLPLDRDSQMRLGRALNKAGVTVYAIITGQVRSAKVVPGPRGVEGRVEMAVLMRDLSTGEYVNGALQQASSSPKPGYQGNEDALIDEALTTAADKCVLTIASQRLAEVTIMIVRRDAAIINAGIRDGMRVGMKMVVMRFREPVGYLVLHKVDEKHSEATVTQNLRGIAERDKAIVIYELPQKPKLRFGEAKSAKKRTILGSQGLWGIVGAVAMLAFLGGGNKESPGEGAPGGVVASALANAAALRWMDITGQAIIGMNMVTWRGPERGSEELLAYIIYRDGQLAWIARPREGGGYYFIDPFGIGTTVTAFQQATVSIDIDATTGVVTTWDRTVETLDSPCTGGSSVSALDQSFTATFCCPQTVPGVPYTYQVQRLARYAITSPGGTTAAPPAQGPANKKGDRAKQAAGVTYIIKLDSPLSILAGPASMTPPPPLVKPIQNASVTNPSAVEFSWTTVAGADDYVLQISRDNLFRSQNTLTIPAPLGFVPAGKSVSKIVDVATSFPGTGTQVMWWRAGARFTGDQAPPRVQPGWTRTQDAGYVWSLPATFTMTTTSPMPPARGSVTRPRSAR